MTPESPSLLLKRAADKLENAAAVATEGPWRASGYEVYATASEVPVVELGYAEGGFTREEDATWAAMLSPAVAAPLVAWLREAAAAREQYGKVPKALMQDGGVAPAYRFTYHFVEGALEFARLILGVSAEGEERSDPSSPSRTSGISVEEETTQ